jgi:murein DD-endopeptidase MepM/ murein hydrolase activator NlpD
LRRGVLAIAVAFALAAVIPTPAAAAPPPLPDPHRARHYEPYPAQMPAAGVSGQYAATGGGFLTLPYVGDRFISSTFDHCAPTYARDGAICRFDGTIAYAGNGRDPEAPVGYAMAQGRENWLFYDGHDGWDMGLYYEPVLAASDGVVTYADWANPGCHNCSFGQGIRIDHHNGFDTFYGHLWKILVGIGQAVRRGQVIAISGATGAVSGAHLHFGVYHHATWDPVDPYGWEGGGADPWPDDAGNMWLNGAAKPPAVALAAVNVVASQQGDTNDIAVSWSSPGDSVRYDLSVYRDAELSVQLLAGTADTATVFHGDAGHTYWFDVAARTDLGFTDSAASAVVTLFPETPGSR